MLFKVKPNLLSQIYYVSLHHPKNKISMKQSSIYYVQSLYRAIWLCTNYDP